MPWWPRGFGEVKHQKDCKINTTATEALSKGKASPYREQVKCLIRKEEH
jgi:hypothetical protein